MADPLPSRGIKPDLCWFERPRAINPSSPSVPICSSPRSTKCFDFCFLPTSLLLPLPPLLLFSTPLIPVTLFQRSSFSFRFVPSVPFSSLLEITNARSQPDFHRFLPKLFEIRHLPLRSREWYDFENGGMFASAARIMRMARILVGWKQRGIIE